MSAIILCEALYTPAKVSSGDPMGQRSYVALKLGVELTEGCDPETEINNALVKAKEAMLLRIEQEASE